MFDFDKDKSTNLTQELAGALRAAIHRGEYSPDQLIPSEREISESCDLSRTTVRRAIQLLVNEGILYRIPGSGTYVGHNGASRSTEDILGLIVPSLANPHYGELANAIEREANIRGYQLLVGQSNYEKHSEANYLRRYAESLSVKGVLIVPNFQRLSVEAYHFMKEQNTPFIFVSRSTDVIDADAVMPDRVHGAAEMVKYLIDLGHEQIAYVRLVPPQLDSHMKGYLQALETAHLPKNPDLIISIEANPYEAGRRGAQILLERGAPFTAVFARNDVIALSVIQALKEAGLRVPEDVSVAGVDNIQATAHSDPPLTTLDDTLSETGRLSVSLLLDRVEGRYNGPSRQVTIRQSLLVRGSCGPPATVKQPAAVDHQPTDAAIPPREIHES